MKSLQFFGERDVRFVDALFPEPEKGEVLIRVAYAGICGSDLHIYHRGMFIRHIPEIMGHEFVGVIEKCGEGVSGFSKGDVVTANPMVPCGHCLSCRMGRHNTCEDLGFIGEVRPGCFAEFMALDASTIVKIADASRGMTQDRIRKYVLTEPLAVALNVLERAHFAKEDRIVIFGAGPIGCLTAALAKQYYQIKDVTVVDLAPERLRMAKKLGADRAVTDEKELDFGYAGTVDCAGAGATIRMALSHVAPGGKVCIVSIFEKETGIDCNDIVNKELRIIGCNAYRDEYIAKAAEILAQRKVSVEELITDEYDLKDGKEAFAYLDGPEKRAEKVVFRM